MGVCSCRKRADLFCFVHRKAVCSSCILDHPTCVVEPYLDWLRDSDYVEPLCQVCNGKFDETSPSVRLTCRHIIHPSCMEHQASSLPAHTAQAGYTCLTCTKPIIPSDDDKSDLADALRDVLVAQAWSKGFLEGNGRNNLNIHSPEANRSNGPVGVGRDPFTFTPVSRKGDKDDIYQMEYDSDSAEHKYKRRGMTQLLVALGILTPGQSGHMLNSRRLVLIFLAISILLLFWVLFKSSTGKPTVVV